MEITITKTFEEKYEISLPHYRKNDSVAFKVISTGECIKVANWGHSAEISTAHAELAFHLSDVKECTEAEFEEMYTIVSERLLKIKNQSNLKELFDCLNPNR